ncbi:MAG: hypothetical protein WAW06_11230 [bacterium]
MAFYDRLMSIDRRIVFLSIGLAVAIPLLLPIGIPVQVSEETMRFYREMEALKPGDVILLSFDYEGDVMAEVDPMAIAAMNHAFSKDLKVVSLTTYAGCIGIAERVLANAASAYGKTYGEDYVFLGYNPDWSGTILRLGESFKATYPTDQHGRSTGEIPLMQRVETYRDIGLIVSISGSALSEYWAIWAGGRYGAKVISGNTAIQAISIYPYYQAHQILGFLGGLKGAAEYEKMIGKPAMGVRGMDAQSVAHSLMVVFIIVGNLGYFLSRRAKRLAGARPAGTK